MQRPIGAIVDDLKARLSPDRLLNLSESLDDARAEVWTDMDSRFGARPDYKLWRSGVVPWLDPLRFPSYETRHSTKWSDWAEFARLSAESSDPIVFWSTVALAPDLIDAATKQRQHGSNAAIWGFVDRLRGRLLFEFEPLTWCPASCGIAAAIFLMRHQTLLHKSQRRTAAAEVRMCLRVRPKTS